MLLLGLPRGRRPGRARTVRRRARRTARGCARSDLEDPLSDPRIARGQQYVSKRYQGCEFVSGHYRNSGREQQIEPDLSVGPATAVGPLVRRAIRTRRNRSIGRGLDNGGLSPLPK